MEKVLLNFSLILVLIYFYKITRHGLHIWQLENYYLDRYVAWMKRYIKKVFNAKAIVLLFIPILIFVINADWARVTGYVFEILVLMYLIFTNKKQKEKKPFVVTARIKRVYTTYLVLFAIAAVCANVFDSVVVLSIINGCAMFAYLFVYVVGTINKPIEGTIRRGFCKKAKNKLKDIPGLKVVGITGSYGKTSTKYIVNTILSQKYNTLMTPESYNTTMGVVRTINEKLTSMHQLFVCEMGAKYVGDIKEITDIVNPTYGLVTAIGPQHLDTFKNLDNVRKTKLELVDSLPDDEGIAFLNWEDENKRNSRITKKSVKFGLTPEADYYAENIEITERGSSFDVVIPEKESIRIKTKLLGNLNILNIVGAVAIADKLGLSADEIKMGAKYIRPVPHRLELRQNPNGSIIIDDAYNSNTKGAKMALEVLKSFEHKKRILITPGIVDLGDKAVEINQELGRNAADSADFVILVGAQQTVPIYNGLREKNYPESNIYVAKNLQDGLAKMNQIMTKDSVILLENDLPDNYL